MSQLNSIEKQNEIREQFKQADAISRLEGYDPDAFEQKQKERIVTGEIMTDEFVQIMIDYYADNFPNPRTI